MFAFIVGSFILFSIGLRVILITYILYRFWKGKNYFKRVVEWNTEVLYQMITIFLKKELKFKGYDTEEYFLKHVDDL